MRLEARNLKKEYSPGTGVIDVSLDANGGDIVTLIDPNGSGKSTMVRILVDASVGEGGEFLDGMPVSATCRKSPTSCKR